MSDAEKLTAIERLEALLDEKDAIIAKFEAEDYERSEEADADAWKWTKHSTSDEKDGLPVPRLEIRWRPLGSDEWNWFAAYDLIYRHLLGHVVRIPIGGTRRGGGKSPPLHEGKVETPFRDGAHIRCEMRTLNLPGYAICGDIINKLEPAKASLTKGPAQ